MQQAAATAPGHSVTVIAMCAAGLAVLAVGAWGMRKEIAAANGLDKIVALANTCFAAPLAVFGATHLFDPQSLLIRVPSYMPWRPFWVYFVGCALIAAAFSIAEESMQRAAMNRRTRPRVGMSDLKDALGWL